MTEAEKELIFSNTMTSTVEGKFIRDIIKDYLDSQGLLHKGTGGVGTNETQLEMQMKR